MATFGLTTIGASSNAFTKGFGLAQLQTSGATAGTANSVEGYFGSQGAALGIVYNTSGTDVTTLVGYTSVIAPVTASAWNSFTLAGEAISASTKYGIGIQVQSTSGVNPTIFYDSTTGDRGVGTMSNTPPSTWTTDSNNTGRIYSFYVDYTEDAGGATGKSNPLLGCFGGCLAGAIA